MMNAERGVQNADAALLTALHAIRERIAAACQRAGRRESDVTLVAVSKTVSADRVRAAIAAGVKVLGENRVQEAETKITELAALREQVEWHLIGHLQSNKVRKAVALFDVVQSVDDANQALRLNRVAGELGKRLPVFVEVNLANEASKSGVAPAQVLPLLETIGQLPALELRGLMTVPPYFENPAEVRPFFRQLRDWRDKALRAGFATCTQLSMGMSHDFEVAIEEGATLVRIGTALFGARTYTL
jgi:hypothetical protein